MRHVRGGPGVGVSVSGSFCRSSSKSWEALIKAVCVPSWLSSATNQNREEPDSILQVR